MLQKEEAEIVKMCQAKHFSKEAEAINTKNRELSTSRIHQLDLFLDKDGVFRVGGRLANENFSHELKHTVFVSKYCTISQLIIRHYHEKTAHSGRGMTINETRNAGNQVINYGSAVKSMIANCVILDN